MTEERQPVDPFQVWREWLTESERHWNSFFQDVLGNDQFASGMNRLVETQIGVQRLMAEGTERFLKMWSVPTSSDVNRVDDRLTAIEERLAGIEQLLSDASSEPAPQELATPVEIRRTRQPPAENNSSFGI
jgi:polyhydroxyalkanoic acid synthase PhaR subunit